MRVLESLIALKRTIAQRGRLRNLSRNCRITFTPIRTGTFTVATTPASGISARTASGRNLLPQIRERNQRRRERVRRSQGHDPHRELLRQNHLRAGPNTRPAPQPKPGQPSIQPAPNQPQPKPTQPSTRPTRPAPEAKPTQPSNPSIQPAPNQSVNQPTQPSTRPTRPAPETKPTTPTGPQFSLRRHPDSIATRMHETGHGQQGRRRSRRELRRRITRGNRSPLITRGILRRTINRRRVRIIKTSGNDSNAARIKTRASRGARIDSLRSASQPT